MSDESKATDQPDMPWDEALRRPLGGFSPSSPNYRPLLPLDLQGPTVPSRTVNMPKPALVRRPESEYPTLPDGVPTPGRVPVYAPAPMPAPRSVPLAAQPQPRPARPTTPAQPSQPVAPPSPYVPSGPYGAPQLRRNSTPVAIEAVAALFGLFGLGWLYAGRNSTGILLIAGGLVWDVLGLALLSTGIGAICFLPVHAVLVTLSAVRLSSSIRRSGYV
ncbi:MAG TPA: hypothetical protein VF120_17500 [Ktedonobacterales bacterium]